MRTRYPSDAEWIESRVSPLPYRWAHRLRTTWERTNTVDHYAANVELRETTASLLAVRIPLDASDDTICEAARELANRCASGAELFHSAQTLRAAMERVCAGQGISPPHTKKKDRHAIARMTCERWWRRQLRKHQGQTVEAAAIRLGLVNRQQNLYVSEERFQTRVQQLARNAASLEATIARNELGDEFTLAELADKSSANKRIRRAEVMTRIAGFERIAQDLGHSGLFVTLTCPSRFHRFRTVNGGKTVLPNSKYDPNENPKTAQKHLSQVWQRIRAYLDRREITLYGLRIVEPQHDGTPHWHLLVFCDPTQEVAVKDALRRYALQDTPDEPGASVHRCDIKAIDWSRGSAAGYVIKYVSKNLDGHGVGEDFNGKPAIESARRVEAWASTWGIRQFQFVGGAPVTVWRELRRIEALPEGAPAHLREAHAAANKAKAGAGEEEQSVSWDRYCRAQGGVCCGRSYRIRLSLQEREGMAQYGEERTLVPVGVETTEKEYWTPPWMAHMPGHPVYKHAERVVTWFVESNRHTWEIVKARNTAKPHPLDVIEVQPEVPQREEIPGVDGPLAPWTCVNNCTPDAHHWQMGANTTHDLHLYAVPNTMPPSPQHLQLTNTEAELPHAKQSFSFRTAE